MASDKTDKKVERKVDQERERQGLRRGSVPDTKTVWQRRHNEAGRQRSADERGSHIHRLHKP